MTSTIGDQYVGSRGSIALRRQPFKNYLLEYYPSQLHFLDFTIVTEVAVRFRPSSREDESRRVDDLCCGLRVVEVDW